MAALAPMPSASVTITASASPGVRKREWYATLRSRTIDIFLPPDLARGMSIKAANTKTLHSKSLSMRQGGQCSPFQDTAVPNSDTDTGVQNRLFSVNSRLSVTEACSGVLCHGPLQAREELPKCWT